MPPVSLDLRNRAIRQVPAPPAALRTPAPAREAPPTPFIPGKAVAAPRAVPLPPEAAALREAIRRVLGEPPRELDVVLSRAPAKHLARLQAALERLEAAPPSDRLAAARQAAHSEWLVNGRSLDHVAARFEIALDTGYVLVDRGPLGSNPHDDKGFSDDDVRRLQPLLTGLPPALKNAPGLVYVTRDARSEADDQLLEQLKRSVDESPKPFARALGKLLVGAVDRLNMGAAFGTAYYGSREIRLYSELFTGSKLPGFEKMLAYTTIHEIGHHALRGDPAMFARWSAFYEATGRAEAPNGYAGGSVDEGFGVALGMYGVAPDTLKQKSPQTYAFFRAEYGGGLAAYRGRGLEPKVIELVYGLQDAALKNQHDH